MTTIDRSDELREWYAEDDPDGAQVLDDLEKWFGRFIKVTFGGDLALLALWTVHTHLAAELYTTPRLQLDSIMPESGKTTALDHLNRLCFNPIQMASTPSPALIPRLLEREMRTLLFDEVDRTLRPDGPGTPDLLAIINSGYRVGATRPVLVPIKGGGWEASEMPTHAPVAIAGNAPVLADDTRSRCIRLLLMPDTDGSIEDSDWEHIEDEARALHDRVARFADHVRDQIKGLPVDLPPNCIARTKEKWRPLKRVAVVAGGRWPAVADELIRRSLDEDAAERDAGLRNQPPAVVLMTDLHSVFSDHDELVPTRELVAKLIGHNPDYWGVQSSYGKALTEHRFGKLVSQASKVTSQRPGGRGPRGFFRSQFEPVWRRLRIGAPPSETGATGYTGETGADSCGNNQMHRNNRLHRSETHPLGNGAESGFTPPDGPDRCSGCHWHVPTMGHKPSCPANQSGAS
ncbi:DUF3631 domain-containing protein [Mycobacterium sp. HUMS_1102779]|uniref:DUF3631 domain-containing protein n=1 Tax=Mycobacterium sp. HUMS_1102779 TaxID=3383487 RepID=UPI003899A251